MAKIYTSRFSNPELQTGDYTVVGIVRGMPRFNLKYHLAGNIIQIAPPGYLFHENDRERFTEKYFQYMDGQGLAKIQSLLGTYLNRGKDTVLCCYEDVRIPDEWCHRLVFAEWYEKETGIRIEELVNPSEIKYPRGKKSIEAPEKKESTQSGYEQMTLFGC